MRTLAPLPDWRPLRPNGALERLARSRGETQRKLGRLELVRRGRLRVSARNPGRCDERAFSLASAEPQEERA